MVEFIYKSTIKKLRLVSIKPAAAQRVDLEEYFEPEFDEEFDDDI